MKTVILGGPALALDNSIPTRHYTIIDVEDGSQIASLIIDVDAKTRNLIIHKSDYSEAATSAVCKFMKSVFPTYASIPFTADDGNAVALTYMLKAMIRPLCPRGLRSISKSRCAARTRMARPPRFDSWERT
jgi:hypothetical protein